MGWRYTSLHTGTNATLVVLKVGKGCKRMMNQNILRRGR